MLDDNTLALKRYVVMHFIELWLQSKEDDETKLLARKGNNLKTIAECVEQRMAEGAKLNVALVSDVYYQLSEMCK